MINQSNRLGVEELESRVVPAWISWVGGSGDWADPVNWSGGKVPTAQDDVTISDWFNNLTITIGTGTNAAVRSLSASESLVVEGSLAIHNWANVSGFVEIASGGAIDVPTTGSYISMTGGSEISGDFHIAEKGFVNLDGDSILHTSGTLSGKGQYGIYSKLTFSGGSQSIARMGTAESTILDGDGDVTITDYFGWGGGTIKGTGSFTIADGSYGELVSYWGPSIPTELEDKTFKVAPTGTFVMWSDLLLIGTSAIENEGLFDLAEDAVVIKAAPDGSPTFINDGEFRGSGAHTVVEIPFVNYGTVVTKARIDFYDFNQNSNIAELNLDGGGYIHIAQGSIELGVVQGLDGGTIVVDSTIDGSGSSLLTLKKIDEFTANLVADNASEVQIVDKIWFDSARVDLYGLTKWTGGDLDLSDTIITNHVSGVLLIQSNNTIRFFAKPISKVVNHGKIIKSSDETTLFHRIHFKNTGSAPWAGVELLDGTITFSRGTGEHSGEFKLHEGTVVEFLNTEHDFHNGTHFLGEGVVEASGLTYLRIPINHDVSIDNLKLLSDDHHDVLVGGGRDKDDNPLVGGTLWVHNSFLWDEGIIESIWFNLTGTGEISPTAQNPVLHLRSNATLKVNGVLDWNSGNVNVTELARIVVDGSGEYPGVFNVNTDNTLHKGAGVAGMDLSVVNGGKLRRNGGAGISIIELPVYNTMGVVYLNGFKLDSGYTQWGVAEAYLNGGTVNVFGNGVAVHGGKFFLVGGTLNVPNGLLITGSGTLSGPGTIQGNVNNDGLVEVGGNGLAGLLTIQGNFTQGISGNTRIELGGLQPGTQYDRLAITGNASLAGKLELALINNFVPAKADTFAILTYATRNGKFDTITGTNLGNGLSLNEEYQATQLLLEVD